MKCPNCGHDNDVDAEFCEKCGASLINRSGMQTLTKALILIVIILVGLVAVFASYTYFSSQNQTPVAINQSIENATNTTWIPEYLTFDEAKSIALKNAATDVKVSDPILMKDRTGQAIYVCYYYYKGYSIGGIIINAKTGDIIYKEQNLPSNYNQQSSNKQNQQNTNYDEYDYQDEYEITCPECDGYGWIDDPEDPDYIITCPTCDGSGYVTEGG